MSVFLLFLLALAAGTLSTRFQLPEDVLGRGYFQLLSLTVLGLISLALVSLPLQATDPFRLAPQGGRWLLAAALGSALLHYAAVWSERWRGSRRAAATTLVAVMGCLLLAGFSLPGQASSSLPYRRLLLTLTLSTSALLLGWSLATMWLGHWYLILPGLDFRYLIGFCRTLLGVVLLRWLSIGVSLVATWSVDVGAWPRPWHLLASFEGQGMFFWFRLIWGLGIPLLLAWMALQCARQRSNQSATGILYVLLMGTLIGEITGLYLTATTGIPL